MTEPVNVANKFLSANGLPTLDNPGAFVEAFARKVVDHQHFRRLLVKCEPDKRRIMYETLVPHLVFEPWPLDKYIAWAGEIAEREQQMTMMPDGTFRAFRVPEIKSEPAD